MRKLVLISALLLGCSDSKPTNQTPTGRAGSANVPDGGDVAAGAGGEGGAGGEAGSEPGMDAGPPPPGDTCDDAVDVNELGVAQPDGALVVSGTNVAARKDLEVCDQGGTATQTADVVYRYTASATGGLRWTLEETTPTRFVVDVRTSCADMSSTTLCDECGVNCTNEMELNEGDTLFFIISGVPTTNSPDGGGSFELSFLLTPDPGLGDPCVSPNAGGRLCPEGSECQEPLDGQAVCGSPVCGDGFLGFMPLSCEDGNMDSGDGCSSTCEFDAQGPGSATCSDLVTLNLPRIRGVLDDSVHLYGGATGDFVAGSDLDASCSAAAGPEAVYVFELTAPSPVQITAENAEVLSLRRAEVASCGTEEVDCVTGAPTGSLVLDFAELEAGRYAVILDREEPTLATTSTYVFDVMVGPTP